MVIIMEPDDNQQQQCSLNLTKMRKNQFISENSDNLHSVEEIQTSRRRRKRTMSPSKVTEEEHQCSANVPSRVNRIPLLSSWSSVSSSTSSSSSPLVLFILASALLLFLCITPSHSLPFDGRRQLSSSGGSSSHRSHMDLLIDPIHQAEYGDDDPFENKRIVKSVFDMVLRTPPPPTTSSSRCPPGTQSPFEGGPCIKKSTDPVAFVDQSFLLDTLRGLAQEGALMRGPQKTRRPGSNRRRPSGRPGSRTTSTTTTVAPSTTVSSEEDESASTTFTTNGNGVGGGGVADTGDNNANLQVEEIEEAVMAVTQETPSPSPSTPSVVETETILPAIQEVGEEEAVKIETGITDASASATIIPDVGDTETTTIIDTINPAVPEDSPSSSAVVTVTTPTTPTTTEESVKNGADLRRTAEPEMAVPSTASSSSSNENDELIAGTTTIITQTQTTLKTVHVQPSEATTTTSTTIIPTIASPVGTASQQQVKSDQVHKVSEQSDEQVPTIMMSQTTKSKQESGANNNTDLVQKNQKNLDNIMGNSQISLESQAAAEIQQDDHHHTQSTPLTTPSTFPKEEFLTVDVTPQAHHQEKDVFVSSTISPITATIPASSQPVRMMTTMNPPIPTGAVTGAENHVVTGVTNPSVHHDQHQHQPLLHEIAEQEIPTNVQSPSFDDHDDDVKIKDISVELPEEEVQISHGTPNSEENGKEGVIGKMAMRLIQAGETPQQIIEHLDKAQTDKDGETVLQLSQNSESILQSSLQQPNLETWSPLLVLSESKEESLKDRPAPSAATATSQDESKVTDSITEKTNATIGDDNQKVPRPLGPLDSAATQIKTIVEQEQVVHNDQDGNNDSDEKAEAGDMNVAAATKNIEASGEQGDNLPSSAVTVSAVVNHLKDGDKQVENDKGRETVTVQVDNADMPIINVNFPSSVSPVQQNHHQKEIKIVEDPVKYNDPSGGDGEISSSEESSSGSRELEKISDFSQTQHLILDPYHHHQPITNVAKDYPVQDTTISPPPPSTTTGTPPRSPSVRHVHPTETLLQFQLPIVTSLPTSSQKNHPENVVGGENDSFQKFQEFPSFSNSGKVRFPTSAEADHDVPAEGGQSSGRAPFKPIFVQDFNLDYPPARHAAPQPPPQEWQAPQPFQLPQSNITPEQQKEVQPEIESPLAPEYYDSGSTEYLESELDRRHQKSRSRNRIRNSPEPAPSTAATTNTPPMYPPELSFYSPAHAPASVQVQPQQQQAPTPIQNQQQQYHHQPSMYFARRNPSSDLIPFGYLNFRTGHDRFHHNNRRLVW